MGGTDTHPGTARAPPHGGVRLQQATVRSDGGLVDGDGSHERRRETRDSRVLRAMSVATLPRGSRAAAGPSRAGTVASRAGRAPRRVASHREGDRGDALLPRVAQGVVQHGDVRDGRQRAGEMRVFPGFAETRRAGFPGFAPGGVHPDGRARGAARAGLGRDGDHRGVGQLPGGGHLSHPPLRPRHETRVPVQTHLRHDPQPHARRGPTSRGHARAKFRRVSRPEKRRRSERRVGARRRRAASRGGTRRRGGGGGSRGVGGGDGARTRVRSRSPSRRRGARRGAHQQRRTGGDGPGPRPTHRRRRRRTGRRKKRTRRGGFGRGWRRRRRFRRRGLG